MKPSRLDEEELDRLPLFPLPATVFFPRTSLRLHVFERRYREMVEYCLETQRPMAVVLLRPGFEEDYEGRPPIFDVAGAGRMREACKLADGSFDILLHGTERVRVIEELPAERPFRMARCVRVEDEELEDDISDLESCLRGLAVRLAGAVPEIRKPILSLLEEIPDGSGLLADQIACRLMPDALARQRVLEESDVRARHEQVIREVAEVCLRLSRSRGKCGGALN